MSTASNRFSPASSTRTGGTICSPRRSRWPPGGGSVSFPRPREGRPVMRQICPNCLKSIDVPESAAGGEYDCPACGKPFPVPRAYAPAVFATPPGPVVNPSAARTTSADPGLPTVPAAGPVVNRPAPPPGLVPPAPPPPETHTGPEPAGGGPLRHHGFTLDPRVLPWLPVFCLALCLVLSFFPWVGAYPGGYRVFSQTPWEAGVGGLTPVPTA